MVLPQSSQPLGADLEGDADSGSKPRKATRRQSGLLSLNSESLSVPRAPSPAFGSPIRRAAGLAEEEEEIAVVTGQLVEVDFEVTEINIPVKKRKSRGKEKDPALEVSQPRERKRAKEKTEDESSTDGGGKPRLKDVTNHRAALTSIGNTGMLFSLPFTAAASLNLDLLVREQDVETLACKTFLEPTPSESSSPVPQVDNEGPLGGRERRARKSVNYAEPKLNT